MARRRAGTSRKVKTASELHAEAEQAMRKTLMDAGVPEHRVIGVGVRSFTVANFTDIAKHRSERRSVLRVSYPGTVDKWLQDGGPGFEEPQRRAIDHVRKLWACAGTAGRQVANYDGFGGGTGGREGGHEQAEALTQLSRYEDQIPRVYWSTFEMLCRDDFGAGAAGAIFADNSPQRIAHAKGCVGFVASLIAMWRGY